MYQWWETAHFFAWKPQKLDSDVMYKRARTPHCSCLACNVTQTLQLNRMYSRHWSQFCWLKADLSEWTVLFITQQLKYEVCVNVIPNVEQILTQFSQKGFRIYTWRFYASPARRRYFFNLSVCPSHYCERDISQSPWGNFIKSGTNVHLDSNMNWSEFGGQRSRSRSP